MSKKNTGRPLRVLIVEDTDDDITLLVRELRHSGFNPSYECVKSADDLITMLDNERWDLIISDYTLPGFSGIQALSIVRSRATDAPFIFVSATMGEDIAVSAMRAGAQDYVMKGNLKRLGPAIERELRESEVRREHERAEAERRIADDRFRQILMIAADAIVGFDENLRIVIFNQRAEAIFGYRADEAMGQFIDLLMPPHLVAGERQIILELMSSSSPVQTTGQRDDLVGQRKNGEEFPAEVTISKLTHNGRTTFTAIIRDISSRLRVERRLRHLSRAVEQSANLIILTDIEGTVEFVNPKFIEVMGYSASEVIGQKPSLWRSGLTGNESAANLWSTILAGNEWRGEFQNKRKDGGIMIASATVAPVKDDQERITHFVSIQEDITQLREIEMQNRRSQRLAAIGQLTGGVAHDFNNLLTIAIGNLDLLLEDQDAMKPEAKDFAQAALDSVLRGASLTRQLLAFARGQILESATFDLNQLVSGTTLLLQRTLGEQIEVETILAGDLWLAHADPKQMEAALTNLAINSRDAMPSGGRLTIETANRHLDEHYAAQNAEVTPGDYVMLMVSDTGTGMPPEIRNRVFEPFFTTKEQGQGTGLGLSMVYGYAKQSKGHVSIYSEVGHGTTIQLYLPRAQDAVVPGNDEAVSEPGSAARGTKILVVDDNPGVRGVVVKQLLALGYRVADAPDGATALDILQYDKSIDLLFTDMVMPGGMTGIDLVYEARKIRPQLRVLLTTGFAETTIRNSMQSGEITNILSKPYRRQDLAQKIQSVLSEKV